MCSCSSLESRVIMRNSSPFVKISICARSHDTGKKIVTYRVSKKRTNLVPLPLSVSSSQHRSSRVRAITRLDRPSTGYLVESRAAIRIWIVRLVPTQRSEGGCR